MEYLNEYEKTEIIPFENAGAVYYTGKTTRKLIPKCSNEINVCYDNKNGFYRMIRKDHLNYRFEIYKTIGRGGFGCVVEAFDHKLKQRVAIKVIRNREHCETLFHSEIEKLERIKTQIQNNKWVVHMIESFNFRNHRCIVFEYLHNDLFKELKKGGFKGLEMNRLREISESIIQGLAQLHEIDIIHGDIKPSNVALARPDSNQTKIIDFGCSLFKSEAEPQLIQTLYYRAPEIILRLPFNETVDSWSLGCTLFELFTGDHLWEGQSEYDQLVRITEVLGVPPKNLVMEWRNASAAAKRFFDANGYPVYSSKGPIKPKRTRMKVGKYGGVPGCKSLQSMLERANNNLTHFICSCLAWDPEERLTSIEALQHPWINKLLTKDKSTYTKKTLLQKGKHEPTASNTKTSTKRQIIMQVDAKEANDNESRPINRYWLRKLSKKPSAENPSNRSSRR